VPGKLAPIPSFKISGPDAKAIQLETIKRGEDDKGDGVQTIILRMHESYGGRAKGTLDMSVKKSFDLLVNRKADAM
jgi:alpha-mannosidase